MGNNIGELIIEHYEKFLGVFEDCLIFKSDEVMPSIQLLQYDKVFEGCKTYATIGLSWYADIISGAYEVVMVVDDDAETSGNILANVLFYIINNNVKLDNGTYIEGIKNINEDFFISEEECNFIRRNGCDKFEEFLEENNVDVMDINR